MKAWLIENDDGIDALNLTDVEIGDPGPGEVRVKIKTSSINRRDMNTVIAPSARNTPLPRIPNSDGAGEVVAVGDKVSEFNPGDRGRELFLQTLARGQNFPRYYGERPWRRGGRNAVRGDHPAGRRAGSSAGTSELG